MAEITTHRGVVVETCAGHVKVRVDDDCRCDGCAIATFCGTKNDDAIVTLDTPMSESFNKGDVIEFEPATSSQWLSIFFAFVAPILLILIVVLLLLKIGWNDLLAVLLSFVLLVAYFAVYAVLYRKGMLKPMKWTIRLITQPS